MVKQEKQVKGSQIRKKEVKPSLFADGMIIQEIPRNLQKTSNTNKWLQQDYIIWLTYKNQLHFYIKKHKIIYNCISNIECLDTNLTKHRGSIRQKLQNDDEINK